MNGNDCENNNGVYCWYPQRMLQTPDSPFDSFVIYKVLYLSNENEMK
jgi:hypothetical protein